MPPGWYPDPGGVPLQRYWDGRQWTPYTQPIPDWHQQEMLRLARQSTRNTGAIRSTITALIIIAIFVYVIIRLNHNVNGG